MSETIAPPRAQTTAAPTVTKRKVSAAPSLAPAPQVGLSPAYLLGTGVHIPQDVITNAELVESFNAWVKAETVRCMATGAEPPKASSEPFIVKASGIEQRHVLSKDGILDPERMMPRFPERANDELSIQAEFAVASAGKALAAAGVAPHEIDMVICSCAHHQRPYPALAVEVQQALGTSGAAFDMNVACSATTFAMHMATGLVRSGAARKVLVVSPEIMSGHLNWRDRQTHFIFGDASAAAVIGSEPGRGAGAGGQHATFEIVDTRTWTQFSSNIRSNFGFLNRTHDERGEEGIEHADRLVTQQGQKVFREVTAAVDVFLTKFLADHGLKADGLRRYWLHQANLRLNLAVMNKLLGAEPSEDLTPHILHKYGNVAAPGSLIAFHENHADFEAGEEGVICSFGAGYSIGALLLRRV